MQLVDCLWQRSLTDLLDSSLTSTQSPTKKPTIIPDTSVMSVLQLQGESEVHKTTATLKIMSNPMLLQKWQDM